MPEPLPIDAHLGAVRDALAAHGALVLTAEPGAGKTTRVPPFLVDAGLAGAGMVVVLEPRRVAARAAAARIAEERGEEPGGFAGWHVRFDRRASPRTRVLVVTEGILTRRLADDPELRGVGAVVLDEFHERTIHADLALALLRDVRESLRPDLKLVVMSATLEAEPAAAFLGGAPILRVPGRAFPLEIERLAEPDARPLPIRAAAGVRRALDATSGDVLVFLPGLGEIARTAEALADLARERGVDVLPLHGELRPEEQDRALRPSRRRKVVLATNVAETSVTVPGATAVVDTGYARRLEHDPGRGMDRLELRRISRASATQRAGRAGRTGPGRVFRLWTAAEETAMPERETPEIRRIDLASVALEIRLWGEPDLRAFRWFEAPDPAALERAEALLRRLGALDAAGKTTPLAPLLARFAAPPRLARLLLAAAASGVPDVGSLAAALLGERDLVRRSPDDARRGASASGACDLAVRRDAFLDAERGRAGPDVDRGAVRAVAAARDQHLRALRSLSPAELATVPRLPPEATADDDVALRRLLLTAFPDRVARRRRPGSPEAVMVGGGGATLAPTSVVRDAEFFLVLDGDLGRRGIHAGAVVRAASAVERAWLDDVAGGPLKVGVETSFDDARGRVTARRVVRYEDLVVEEGETGAPDRDAARRLLFEAARRDPSRALGASEAVEALLGRLRALRAWAPELDLPTHDPEDLVRALEPWADGVVSLEGLRALDLSAAILGRLTRRQRAALDEQAPEALVAPSGMTRRLRYEDGKPPVWAVKLQELFGLAETPRVGGGRVPLTLHLLAPDGSVAQITQDLASFWRTTYAQVRKDLRGRYPKHPWPEDPWTAVPTHRAKPRR